jgi:phage head maturation protease
MNELIYKSITASAPIAAEPSGLIRALVHSTEQRDRQNDIVHKNAWAKVISSGKMPKILVNHEWGNLPVGRAIALQEWQPGDLRLPAEHLEKGWGALVADIQCDMTRQSGRDFFAAVQGEYLDSYSVGFLSDKSLEEYRDGARHIPANGIIEFPEVSGVLVPAVRGTQTLSTKSAVEPELSDDLKALIAEMVTDEFLTPEVSQARKTIRPSWYGLYPDPEVIP